MHNPEIGNAPAAARYQPPRLNPSDISCDPGYIGDIGGTWAIANRYLDAPMSFKTVSYGMLPGVGPGWHELCIPSLRYHKYERACNVLVEYRFASRCVWTDRQRC